MSFWSVSSDLGCVWGPGTQHTKRLTFDPLQLEQSQLKGFLLSLHTDMWTRSQHMAPWERRWL